MISKELIKPQSIAVIGASNDLLTPGGSLLKNLIMNNYSGSIHPVSKSSPIVQGLNAYSGLEDIPDVDLGFIAEDDGDCLSAIEILCSKKSCKAIVVFPDKISSPSLSEEEVMGKVREICSAFSVTLIGPNSAGVANSNYCGIYTNAALKEGGKVEIISSSRTTISHFVESAPKYGLDISGIVSVGYSPLTTVEDLLQSMDENWEMHSSVKVIAIYIEKITDSEAMIRSSRRLRDRGVEIVGVLASPTKVVSALFEKCGIIRAFGKDELLNIAAILSKGRPDGKRVAILTQAGGPAVLLGDVLRQNGVEVTRMFFEDYSFGKTAGQISSLIDFYDKDPGTDRIVVIFGQKEMSDSSEVSNVIFRKVRHTVKPVYPLFSSESSYKDYLKEFHRQGGVTFRDEVVFGKSLSKVLTMPSVKAEGSSPAIDKYFIKRIIDESPDGWMHPFMVEQMLDAAGINRVRQAVALNEDEAVAAAIDMGYPVVMKVVGPLHKTEVDGVSLNITDEHTLRSEYRRMSNREGVTGFLLQPMVDDNFTELQVTAQRQPSFAPLVSCSLGGIFADAMGDISYCLAPVSVEEADKMIESLKAYPIIRGYREQEGVSQIMFNEVIRRVSALCLSFPQIVELELNPLFGNERTVMAVGARIKIEK